MQRQRQHTEEHDAHPEALHAKSEIPGIVGLSLDGSRDVLPRVSSFIALSASPIPANSALCGATPGWADRRQRHWPSKVPRQDGVDAPNEP